MRPVLKFILLAGLFFASLSVKADDSYRLGGGSIGIASCAVTSNAEVCYPSGLIPDSSDRFSSLSALCAVLPDSLIDQRTGAPIEYSYSCTPISYRLVGGGASILFPVIYDSYYEGGFADDCEITPNSPYCDANTEPEPEPDPFAPDGAYCLQNPFSLVCLDGREPTQQECAFGVGAESCCAASAAQSCGSIENVLSWNLNASLDTCTYSCGDGEFPPPEPPEAPDFDDTPPDPFNPTPPETPELPSDPNDPLSNDLANNTKSINDLNRLMADGIYRIDNAIYKADKNNQKGLQGVIDAVNSAASNNYIGEGSPLVDNFGDGSLSAGDRTQILTGLGLTGNEDGWESLENNVDISDYSSDYDYVISSSGCPAPYQMQLFNSNFELSYQPFCDVFEFVGYLVMLAGVFMTPFIIFGFRGK